MNHLVPDTSIGGAYRSVMDRIWNRLVGRSWKYLSTDATHVHFLHPTKGFRKVSKKRLGIA